MSNNPIKTKSIKHRMFATIAVALVSCTALQAQTFQCVGLNPDWKMNLNAQSADFSFQGRQVRFDIPQKATARGYDWPQAMTLVSPDTTAIVVLDQDICQIVADELSLSIDILTQDGLEPILLTGCCRKE